MREYYTSQSGNSAWQRALTARHAHTIKSVLVHLSFMWYCLCLCLHISMSCTKRAQLSITVTSEMECAQAKDLPQHDSAYHAALQINLSDHFIMLRPYQLSR